jgi:hypothetical protein
VGDAPVEFHERVPGSSVRTRDVLKVSAVRPSNLQCVRCVSRRWLRRDGPEGNSLAWLVDHGTASTSIASRHFARHSSTFPIPMSVAAMLLRYTMEVGSSAAAAS